MIVDRRRRPPSSRLCHVTHLRWLIRTHPPTVTSCPFRQREQPAEIPNLGAGGERSASVKRQGRGGAATRADEKANDCLNIDVWRPDQPRRMIPASRTRLQPH